MSNWKRRDEWSREGKHFRVLVSRHERPMFSSDYKEVVGIEHHWCVYGILFPKHWRFSTIKGKDAWQESLCSLPLHSGCTFLQRYHNDDLSVASIKFGADYAHYQDGHYLLMETESDAYQVFKDADDLFDVLSQPKPEHFP